MPAPQPPWSYTSRLFRPACPCVPPSFRLRSTQVLCGGRQPAVVSFTELLQHCALIVAFHPSGLVWFAWSCWDSRLAQPCTSFLTAILVFPPTPVLVNCMSNNVACCHCTWVSCRAGREPPPDPASQWRRQAGGGTICGDSQPLYKGGGRAGQEGTPDSLALPDSRPTRQPYSSEPARATCAVCTSGRQPRHPQCSSPPRIRGWCWESAAAPAKRR